MPTFTEVQKGIKTTAPTLRRWTAEYAEFLSPHANPPKGETRAYTEEDAAILALVADMRRAGAQGEEIAATLADGGRGDWPPLSDEEEPAAGDLPPMALVTQLTAQAAKLSGQLETVVEERDRLREEVAELREADKRAAVLEREIEIMRTLIDQEKKRPWWRFWE